MILTVNIGNSHITIGCMEKERAVFLERISTNLKKTDLEYAMDIYNAFQLHGIDVSAPEGSIVSSVVPELTSIMKAAIERIFSFSPMIVRAADTHMLKIAIDDPKELGSNLVVNAVAVTAEYGAPAIIIDMGTATVIGITDHEGTFLGTAILPGLKSSLDALSGGTAQLPPIDPEHAVTALGRNTVDCMNGGAVYGSAGMIDAIITRMTGELKVLEGDAFKKPVIVATGKYAPIPAPFLRHPVIVDEFLSLKGLTLIYYGEKEAQK